MTSPDHLLQPLPVDTILDELRQQLTQQRVVVLEAPPGAGKTTRVPPALRDSGWLDGRKILMLEPRRLAARNAAEYMARQLGEDIGQSIGYRIRHESRVSRQTRIEVLTEGILVRRLQSDPELADVGLVIFDEFHERNIHSDLGLALTNDLRQGLREDLRILVMSATLDAGPLVKLLDAGHLRSEGRSWPVDIRYLDGKIAFDCCLPMLNAIRRASAETTGDILAFLPGAREIEQLQRSLCDTHLPLKVCPLHGSLPRSRQLAALQPSPERKLILATNIAETSLTIDGVTTVIDSGLCRRAGFNPGAGLDRLETVKISQASSEQRAGRAGRQGPGVCYRLWSSSEQAALLKQTPPEITNCDLLPLALDLACWGLQDASQLDWLDPPPPGALAAARSLLQKLGLLGRNQRATPEGLEAAKLPTHPRFASMIIQARNLGQTPLACLLASTLSEQGTTGLATDDLGDLLPQILTDLASEVSTSQRRNTFWQLAERLNASLPTPSDLKRDVVCSLLLMAYPDRLARSERLNRDFLLANGQGAQLNPRSHHYGNRWLIICDMTQKEKRRPDIGLAVRAEEGLIEELREKSVWQMESDWDPQQQRIEGYRVKRYGLLELARQQAKLNPEDSLELLCGRIRRDGSHLLSWDREVLEFIERVALLRATFGSPWPDLTQDWLLQYPEVWLAPYLTGITTIVQLGKLKLLPPLQAHLDWTLLNQLDQLAPIRIETPSGDKARIDYRAEGPRLPVKLQQLFGLADTPTICQGRVALTLELLSPAGRPLALTSDLRNFWDQVYPEIKKEMRGRYPKHPWPDDPWSATPTRRTKRHSG